MRWMLASSRVRNAVGFVGVVGDGAFIDAADQLAGAVVDVAGGHPVQADPDPVGIVVVDVAAPPAMPVAVMTRLAPS